MSWKLLCRYTARAHKSRTRSCSALAHETPSGSWCSSRWTLGSARGRRVSTVVGWRVAGDNRLDSGYNWLLRLSHCFCWPLCLAGNPCKFATLSRCCTALPGTGGGTDRESGSSIPNRTPRSRLRFQPQGGCGIARGDTLLHLPPSILAGKNIRDNTGRCTRAECLHFSRRTYQQDT